MGIGSEWRREAGLRPTWATLWGLFLTLCVDELCGAVAGGREASLSGAFGDSQRPQRWLRQQISETRIRKPGNQEQSLIITHVKVTVTVTVTQHGSRITDHE